MKYINLLTLTSIFLLFSCNKENLSQEKSKTEVENAAIKTKTEQLDSMYHINAVSKLPDYVKVEVDSMKVLSIIPIHGKDFLKKLEKHVAENSDKSKPVVGYLTFLSYTANVKEDKSLSQEQQKELLKIKKHINGKQEGINYLNSDLKPQSILTLEL